ncbi:MAG: Ig-like domain-containing protein [Limisphaerales bacterium]
MHDTGVSSTDRITSDGHVTLTGTVSDNNAVAGVEIFDGTTDLGAATISGTTWSFAYNLGAGTHALDAVATDVAGNTTITAAQPTIIVDQTAPLPVITNEVLNKHGAVTLTGTTGEANDTVTVYDGTTLLGTTTTASNGAWSFTPGKVSNVVHTYTATATDVAGNVGHSINEAILGSTKADTLVGTSGNDIINGNGGNDIITGGLGADTLTGGSGNVTFVYNSIADSTPSSHDTITDFTHGHDKIDFTNIAGINASHFQGQLTGSGNLSLHAHSVAYIEVNGNTEVVVNTTAAPEIVTRTNVTAANIEIVLTGIHLGLTASDFHHV